MTFKFVINGGDDDESVASLMAASFMFSRTPRGVILERGVVWGCQHVPLAYPTRLTPLMNHFTSQRFMTQQVVPPLEKIDRTNGLIECLERALEG